MAASAILSHLAILVLATSLFLASRVTARSDANKDLTAGFASMPLNQSNLAIHKPYDIDVAQRHSYKQGVHTLWNFATEKPHTRVSKTHPRSEIRIRGYDYTSGVWQFEAYGYVPRRTSGVCIMQVFGATRPYATTLMLRVYNGSLSYSKQPVLVEDLYDKWFKLNVIHDANRNNVKVFINNELKYDVPGRKATSHFFKCGVYGQDRSSHYMESRWKGIKVLKKHTVPNCGQLYFFIV